MHHRVVQARDPDCHFGVEADEIEEDRNGQRRRRDQALEARQADRRPGRLLSRRIASAGSTFRREFA